MIVLPLFFVRLAGNTPPSINNYLCKRKNRLKVTKSQIYFQKKEMGYTTCPTLNSMIQTNPFHQILV